MLRKLQQAGLIWPTLLALSALAVLLALGSWQLQRKAWKEGLMAKIAARAAAEPVPLARAEEIARGEDVDYLHVAARGRFRHDLERYFYVPAPSGLGWHVYTPLEFAPGRIVWVNRGFVPDERKAPASRAAGQVEGETEVRGLLRAPVTPGTFTPANDVAHNVWHWPDVAALTASAGAASGLQALPLTLDADGRPGPPGGLPRGGVTRLELPNRHLEYALTWYGIALTLIGVYSAFAISRLTQVGKPT